MIKNTELEFEHRSDISCDNFWRGYSCLPISLSKVEERSGHFTILGHDFRADRLGNTNLLASCHIERKNNSVQVDLRRSKTSLLKRGGSV